MSGQPTADLELEPARVQIELVVDDDKSVEVLDAVAAHQRTHRLAGPVHVGLGESERHSATADGGLGRKRGLAALLQGDAVTIGQFKHDLNTDVVPGAGVLVTGIAESDDEQIRRCAAAFLVLAAPA